MKKIPMEQLMRQAVEESLIYISGMAERMAKEKEKQEAEMKERVTREPEKVKVKKTKDFDKQAFRQYEDDTNTAMRLAYRITVDYFEQHPENNRVDKSDYLIHWLNQVLMGMLQTKQWQSGRDLKNMTFNMRRHFISVGIESFVYFVKASFDDNESVLNYKTASVKAVKPKLEPKIETPTVEPSVQVGNEILLHISNTLRLNGYGTTANASNTRILVQKHGQKIASLQMHHGNLEIIDEGAIFAEEWEKAVYVSGLLKEQILIAIQSEFSNREIICLTNEMTKHFTVEDTAHKQYKLQQERKSELIMTLNAVMAITQGFH